jgi:hypothetical protein
MGPKFGASVGDNLKRRQRKLVSLRRIHTKSSTASIILYDPSTLCFMKEYMPQFILFRNLSMYFGRLGESVTS